MKISGYRILIITGMIILHSLPFLVYFYTNTDCNKVFGIFITVLINVLAVGISEIYNDIFKTIDKQMKKEIKLW